MEYPKFNNVSLLIVVLFSLIFSYSGMYFPEGFYIGGEYSTGNHRDADGDKYALNDIGIELSYLLPGGVFDILASYNNEYIEYDNNQLSEYEYNFPISSIGGAVYVINDNDGNFMVSYDNRSEIMDLYKGYFINVIKLIYFSNFFDFVFSLFYLPSRPTILFIDRSTN